MSYGSEAADQVVRMTLSGVEVAARITGKAAERLAALIYSIIKDNRRTRGKGRLNNMLKSGKELAIFTIKDRVMVKFAKEAKRYGILYCVLKDRKANDGVTDIMVREREKAENVISE
ncbi:MAG: PcfB family protein [Lachnospiraceae bacterium]|nr:PcfB family protein [Lachnospiraceae bacterium]